MSDYQNETEWPRARLLDALVHSGYGGPANDEEARQHAAELDRRANAAEARVRELEAEKAREEEYRRECGKVFGKCRRCYSSGTEWPIRDAAVALLEAMEPCRHCAGNGTRCTCPAKAALGKLVGRP